MILVEHLNQGMHPATRNTLSAALALSNDITCFVIGSHCEQTVQQLSEMKGILEVWVVDDPALSHPTAEQITKSGITKS